MNQYFCATGCFLIKSNVEIDGLGKLYFFSVRFYTSLVLSFSLSIGFYLMKMSFFWFPWVTVCGIVVIIHWLERGFECTILYYPYANKLIDTCILSKNLVKVLARQSSIWTRPTINLFRNLLSYKNRFLILSPAKLFIYFFATLNIFLLRNFYKVCDYLIFLKNLYFNRKSIQMSQ